MSKQTRQRYTIENKNFALSTWEECDNDEETISRFFSKYNKRLPQSTLATWRKKKRDSELLSSEQTIPDGISQKNLNDQEVSLSAGIDDTSSASSAFSAPSTSFDPSLNLLSTEVPWSTTPSTENNEENYTVALLPQINSDIKNLKGFTNGIKTDLIISLNLYNIVENKYLFLKIASKLIYESCVKWFYLERLGDHGKEHLLDFILQSLKKNEINSDTLVKVFPENLCENIIKDIIGYFATASLSKFMKTDNQIYDMTAIVEISPSNDMTGGDTTNMTGDDTIDDPTSVSSAIDSLFMETSNF